MLDLVSDLGRNAAQALVDSLGPHAEIPAVLAVLPSVREEFGDFQISAALQLSKLLGKKPRDLAVLMQETLALHPAIETAEIAGAGYVNLTLKNSWLAEKAMALQTAPHRGIHPSFADQTVVVDFSAPNIAKPMHIGHIRSTILGDAIRNILQAVGYKVIADNHLGDWGTQFGKLLVSYKRWKDEDAYEKKPIDELVRLYQLFVSEEKKQADLLGLTSKEEDLEEETEGTPSTKATPLLLEARAELVKLQQGDETNLALWKDFVSASLSTFEKSYQRLHITFDLFLGESFYHPFLGPLVKRLIDEGIAESSQGAIVCHVDGEPAPLLIQKADGAFLYGTTDLATVEYRMKTFHPDRILYVVGSPQQLHFRQVFSIAKKMGISCQLEHISFGSMRFKDKETGLFTTGSTRKGNVPLLDDMLNEAVSRAERVIVEKNPSLEKEEVRTLAHLIGIGAVKYNNLARDRLGDIQFDIDSALSFEGNTAPYIQYAYARLRSMKRKFMAEGGGPLPSDASIDLELTAERTLAKRLLEYPWVVSQVAQSIRIHTLAEYLYSLATSVSQFYHEVPVLKAEEKKRISRLLLLEEVAKTLKHGLSLLGIECPEKM